MPVNNFRHDLNDHTVDNNISYDIANGDIDSLQKLRGNHDPDTRDDCLDDFITYHVAPELKIRPSYEDCLNDNEAEIEILQITAMMIQPSESSTVEDFPDTSPLEHTTLVMRASRHVDNFLRKQGASDL